MNEKEIICEINTIMPTSPLRKNSVYSSDSEVLSLEGGETLFSMDEFSSEDGFIEDCGYTLGWNCAAGAVSDIHASGGYPLILGHSMKLSRRWSRAYTLDFARGVSDLLKETGCQFAGGDLSFSKEWSYTASVIGKPYNKPILRNGAKPGDVIFSSGSFGLGNLFYACKLFKNPLFRGIKKKVNKKLKPSGRISKIISRYATASTDSSDGLLLSLNGVADSSNIGYELSYVPLIEGARRLTRLLKLPSELLFICGAGEYELVFTIPEERVSNFREDIKNEGIECYELGVVTDRRERRIFKGSNGDIDLIPLSVGNREFKSSLEYFKYLKKELKK